MEYTSILQLSRKQKTIIFFLKEGEKLDIDNIVDVEVYNQPERLSPEDVVNEGQDIQIRPLEGHLYDATGNEIIVPKDHVLVCGRDNFSFVKVDSYFAELVYRPERPSSNNVNNVSDSLSSTNK